LPSKLSQLATVSPPAHLDPVAAEKFTEVYPILESRGDIDQGTLDGLACYCQAFSRWTTAEAEVSKLGTVVKSPAGFPVANPYINIAAAAQRQLRQWSAELKLTPRSRKADSDGQSPEALRAAIVVYVGQTFDATIKALKKEIKSKKSAHGWPGNLEKQLRDVLEIGIPWESAALEGANSVRISRTLSAMEREGLLQCFNPSGRRTAAVKLTNAGAKLYKESQE